MTAETELTNAETLGVGFMVGGAISSAVGAYYSIKSQEYQASAHLLKLEWEKSQSYRRARIAELSARDASKAGQERAGRVGHEYAQIIATSDARGGASGTQAGVGSRKEVSASLEWSKDTSLETVNKESADVVANMRMQRGSHEAQAVMLGGKMKGVRKQKGALAAAPAVGSSLLSSGSQFAQAWAVSGYSGLRSPRTGG